MGIIRFTTFNVLWSMESYSSIGFTVDLNQSDCRILDLNRMGEVNGLKVWLFTRFFLNLTPGNQTTCLFNYTSLSCGHSVESMIYACFKPRHYPGRSYKIGYVVGAYPPSKYLHLLELPLSNTLLMYFYSSMYHKSIE